MTTIRVVVEEGSSARCGLRAGDAFEVTGPVLRIPGGRPFCLQAMLAAVPLVMSKMDQRPADDWLERKPFVCCPDPADDVLLRLDRVEQ